MVNKDDVTEYNDSVQSVTGGDSLAICTRTSAAGAPFVEAIRLCRSSNAMNSHLATTNPFVAL